MYFSMTRIFAILMSVCILSILIIFKVHLPSFLESKFSWNIDLNRFFSRHQSSFFIYCINFNKSSLYQITQNKIKFYRYEFEHSLFSLICKFYSKLSFSKLFAIKFKSSFKMSLVFSKAKCDSF